MSRVAFFIHVLFCWAGCLSAKQPNILFISVDDLRPELGCYGADSPVLSPNIDRLAAQGTLFERAYCSIPVCGASRASLLTGMHPLSKRFSRYDARADKETPDVVTLPQQFKENGYFTTAVGKIFHDPTDSPESWSEPTARPDYPDSLDVQVAWRDYRSPENVHVNTETPPGGAPGPAWEAADIPDNGYYDGKTTDMALSKLDALAERKEPFFLGVGYIRPHLPFNAPEKYWDLYDREEIKLAENDFKPENMPRRAYFNSFELRKQYTQVPQDKEPIEGEVAVTLRHGYYACVSFVDAQVGKLMSKLEELGLADDTIIILWGDHGFSLGEHTMWGKHTNFDDALRSPLIVSDPRLKQEKMSNSLVSFIDIYPSLCDMAGLPLPDHLHGKSFAPALTEKNYSVNEYVFSRWVRGETIIDGRYNYTQFFDKSGVMKEDMLYDHKYDRAENKNVVNVPKYEPVVQRLSGLLSQHLTTRK